MARKPERERKKPTLALVELGTRIIDDPYEPGAKLEAVVNLRESPLDRWHDRDQIDGAQFAAGERFRRAWERAAIGGAKAFDWRRPVVDGGKPPEPVEDRASGAFKRLQEAEHELGRAGYYMVTQVIGERVFPSSMARSRDEAEYISRRVRDALMELARMWGMVAEGRR
jgi:hypothetical protein